MVRGFALTCLALAVSGISSVSGCGGRSRQSGDESSETPTVEELVLAKGTDLRFEAISGDASLVAYSSAGIGGEREIWVVATAGGEPERLGTFAELDSGRFDGTTLLLFRGDGVADGGASLEDPCSGKACGPPPEEWSPELLAWRPNDPGLTSLALDVDPGSVRFSRDGRWISLEANDPPHPNSDVPDILLVDTRDLSVRRVGAANLARARFTRQSDWLVIGGVRSFVPAPDIAAQLAGVAPCIHHFVARLSLRDGRVLPVTCYEAPLRSRWEISPDGEWLVHGVRSEDEYSLARTPIAGGEPEILATDLGTADLGKSFDIGGGNRPQVAFITRNPLDEEFALSAIALQAGGAEVLASPVCDQPPDLGAPHIDGIADHHGRMITYHSCRKLWAIAATGGASVSLGANARVLDERDESLLALDDRGALQLFRTSSAGTSSAGASSASASTLGEDVNAARFIATAHVLASAGSGASPWTLTLYDAASSSHSLGEITGPFGVEPGARRFFVTTRASEGQSTLVLGWLRL